MADAPHQCCWIVDQLLWLVPDDIEIGRPGADAQRLTQIRELLWECGRGPAVECSTERSRAPDTQPVAPVEGRAWETPATRTV